ncbi:sugar ABC transporter ATP-binding protein [Nakamurella alba]|uniref:sugar ABC transporter ATP-binding protein n=1 Tax=Nakamurella alba TaxID=2665158 RepID=UPI0018AB6AEA|nr:sugar ABC transporter ATP-binding protein [Nakamurella alba]
MTGTDDLGDRPGEPLLRISGLSKAYGTTQALSHADLTVESGEIHGLLGQNGSGKSTLVKCIAGVVTPDGGRIFVRGEEIPLPLTAARSEQLGLRFVHQNLGLVDSLSVAENLMLEKFSGGQRHIRWSGVFADAEKMLGQYGLRVDPRVAVRTLTPLMRAQVAIARALAPLRAGGGEDRRALLVLDEPTVYLPKKEVGALFDLLRRVVGHGHGVLLVTHRLTELLENTARVSVLRDARIIETLVTAGSSEDEMVGMAVGSEWHSGTDPLEQAQAVTSVAPAEPGGAGTVTVSGLASRHLRGVDLELLPGEIHGFTGLAESGYEELLYAMFGAEERAAGSLTLGNLRLDLSRLLPRQAIRNGVALVPANRLQQGIAGVASIEESLSLPVLERYFRAGRLRLGRMTAAGGEVISKYGIVAGGPSTRVDTLSGGNQQKVLIAKWLQRRTALLLLHEPTQGVDIAARNDIWQFVREAASNCPVLVASSDYDELATLCTRVSIVANGRIATTLAGRRMTADGIAAECLKVPGRAVPREGSR